MKENDLKTFEDIFEDFKEKFKYKIDDVTTIDDFIIGEDYSSYDIGIFAKTYNIQNGIYLIGDEPNYQAIFIKATLKNGAYHNEYKEWIMCKVDLGNRVSEEIPVVPWPSDRSIEKGRAKVDQVCDQVYEMIVSEDFSLTIKQGDKYLTFLNSFYKLVGKEIPSLEISSEFFCFCNSFGSISIERNKKIQINEF
jgi:hypothetical protein